MDALENPIRASILHKLRRGPQLSPADFSTRTGVALTAVERQFSLLQELGLILEADATIRSRAMMRWYSLTADPETLRELDAQLHPRTPDLVSWELQLDAETLRELEIDLRRVVESSRARADLPGRRWRKRKETVRVILRAFEPDEAEFDG